MNTWGPLVRLFMPGWQRAVMGPTWPTWRPHSQIDHILVRGALHPSRARCSPTPARTTGPVRAELEACGQRAAGLRDRHPVPVRGGAGTGTRRNRRR